MMAGAMLERSKVAVDEESDNVCLPEHCYHAFDTLFVALTSKKPVSPKFADDK